MNLNDNIEWGVSPSRRQAAFCLSLCRVREGELPHRGKRSWPGPRLGAPVCRGAGFRPAGRVPFCPDRKEPKSRQGVGAEGQDWLRRSCPNDDGTLIRPLRGHLPPCRGKAGAGGPVCRPYGKTKRQRDRERSPHPPQCEHWGTFPQGKAWAGGASPSSTGFKEIFRNRVGEPLGAPARIRTGAVG